MNKFNCFKKLSEIAELKNGWGYMGCGKKFSKFLIKRCERMLKQINTMPYIRAAFDKKICFDFDNDNISLEIAISNNKISGFLTDTRKMCSEFLFETETDAVNFWNTVTGIFN